MARRTSEAVPEASGMTVGADDAPRRARLRPVWLEGRPASDEGAARSERDEPSAADDRGRAVARPSADAAEPRPEKAAETARESAPESDPAGPGKSSPDKAEDDPARSRKAVSPRRWTLWVSCLVLVALVGAAAWYWLDVKPKRQAAEAARHTEPTRVPVQVAVAARSDVPVFLPGLGNVQAYNTVTVRSRVDGELVEVAFTEGQMVREGDLLAQIDPRPYQAALDQAVAKKAQDESTLASSKLDLQRTQQLAQRSFASQQQLDQQTATVNAQTALVAIDQAMIDNARTQLGYTTIRAPLTGRTGLRLVDRGNIVHASDQTGLVEISQLQPIAVLFTAPQGELPAITAAKKDGKVPVSALTSDGATVLGEGELALVNNAIDAASGTIRLKAVFPNTDEKLWPGLSVYTQLLERTLRDVVSVPADAIQRGPGGLYCYVVGRDGKAERRIVQVGPYSQGRAVVESGLLPGDRVVTAGQYRLTEGVLVQAREAAEPATAPGGAPVAAAPARGAPASNGEASPGSTANRSDQASAK